MSVAFRHSVPALRGWAVRQWCDRLRHPELDVDQAAHQLGALFEGTTSRLAVQLAADLLRRSVDLLQQLHKVLEAAPLHAVAQLALVHALLTGWPRHGDQLTPSRGLLLEAIMCSSSENARDPKRTPAMAAHETTVVQELRQAVSACTELPRMALESSSATPLLAALIGTEAIATAGLNLNATEKGTRAGEKALLDSDSECTLFTMPSYGLATTWEDCDKLMNEVQTEAHEAAVAPIEFDSISAGCANAVYARAWHWPQNEDRDDATTFTPGAVAASDVLTSGTPISERTLTQIFQQLLPYSAVVVPPCFLCTARALAAVLRYNGTAASTLTRVGMRHAASLQRTSEAGRSGALPSSRASHVSELVASLLVTTLTLYADAIFEPVGTADHSPNTLPASGDSPCAEGSTKGERCNRDAHIRQLLYSAERLETSGLLMPIAPFRIPQCATAGSKRAAHNHGDLKSRLLSRQWEGGTHAVLDTLLSAATRAVALTPLLEVMADVVHSRAVHAHAIEAYTKVLLRRHLRPGPWGFRRTDISNDLTSKADPGIAAHMCALLPPARRLSLLAESLPPLLDGLHERFAHFHQALPYISCRLARLESLMQPCEEDLLMNHLQSSAWRGIDAHDISLDGPSFQNRLASTCHTILDTAAWLALRLGGRRTSDSVNDMVRSSNTRLGDVIPGSRNGFDYITSLESCLRTCPSNWMRSALLKTIRTRLSSAWESDVVVRCQIVAVGRLERSSRIQMKSSAEADAARQEEICHSVPSQPLDAEEYAVFLAEAVAAGFSFACPVPIPGFATLVSQAGSASSRHKADAHCKAAISAQSVDSFGRETSPSQEAPPELASLLALLRRGEKLFREVLRQQLSAPNGELMLADFFNYRLPSQISRMQQQIELLSPDPDSDSLLPSEPLKQSPRELRRVLALLMSAMLSLQHQPTSEFVARLVLELPHEIGTGRQNAKPFQVKPSSGPDLAEGGACAMGEAKSALVLESTVRRYLYGVRNNDPLPDVRALGVGLIRKSALSRSAMERAAAEGALEGFHNWIPSDALELACREVLLRSVEGLELNSLVAHIDAIWREEPGLRRARHHDTTNDCDNETLQMTSRCGDAPAIRLLSLLFSLSRIQMGCSPIDWDQVFDSAVCEYMCFPSVDLLGREKEQPHMRAPVIEWIMERLNVLTTVPGHDQASHTMVHRRLWWLLHRPRIQAHNALGQRWRTILQSTVDAPPDLDGCATSRSLGCKPSLEQWVRWELSSKCANDLGMAHRAYLWEQLTSWNPSDVHRLSFASTIFFHIVVALSQGVDYSAACAVFLQATLHIATADSEWSTLNAACVKPQVIANGASCESHRNGSILLWENREQTPNCCDGRCWVLAAVHRLARLQEAFDDNTSTLEKDPLHCSYAEAVGFCLAALPSSLIAGMDDAGRPDAMFRSRMLEVLVTKLGQAAPVLCHLLHALCEFSAQTAGSDDIPLAIEIVSDAVRASPPLEAALASLVPSVHAMKPPKYSSQVCELLKQLLNLPAKLSISPSFGAGLQQDSVESLYLSVGDLDESEPASRSIVVELEFALKTSLVMRTSSVFISCA